MKGSLFEVGHRVVLRGSHSHAGEAGRIVGSRATAFNGWTVKLDSGLHVGVGDEQWNVASRPARRAYSGSQRHRRRSAVCRPLRVRGPAYGRRHRNAVDGLLRSCSGTP